MVWKHFSFKTTEYHWEQFDKNATNIPEDSSEKSTYDIVSGPFQFKKAIKLDKRASGGPQV